MRPHSSINYRPDIDGLRAIAVVFVIIFHAWPSILTGGFVGVDVFFVISGYLISTIVFTGMGSGRFSFVRFYVRRIKRIFPALVVVLVASLVAGWVFLLVDELASVGRYAVGAAISAANFVAWKDAGYFDAATDLKPLLHLWSLGIEEQFYMAWPFVAAVIFRFGAPRMLVVAVLAAASFWLSVRYSSRYPVSAFYLPFTRAWELLAGCLLAAATLGNWHFRFLGANARSVIGAAMICAAAIVANPEISFPGWIALLPVLGAILLISAGPNAWLNSRVLGSRPFVFVGLISYPLYLWHLPLLVFPRIFGAEAISHGMKLFFVAAAVVLAWLTYVLIENPVRSSYRKVMPAALCVLMLLVGVSGWWIHATGGYPNRLPVEVQALRNDTDITAEWRHHRCFLGDGDGPDKFSSECVSGGPDNSPLVFLWGDSHAAALYPGLAKVAAIQGDIRLGQYTASACGPFMRPKRGNPKCSEINAKVLNEVTVRRPNVVLLHADWTSPYYDIQDLRHTLTALRERGVQTVFILGSVPTWTGGLPKHLELAFRRTGAVPARSVPDTSKSAEVDLMAIAKEYGATFVSMAGILCEHLNCLTLIDGRLSAFDTAHLTPAGARFVANALQPVLQFGGGR